MFDTTILKENIERIKQAYVNGQFTDALVKALNTGKGLMRERIFETNIDVGGNSFGEYIGKKTETTELVASSRLFKGKSKTIQNRAKNIIGQDLTTYQRKRASFGHQTNPKNLEFFGSLRRSIEIVVENEKSAAMQFNNDLAAKIAQGQANQIANIRDGLPGRTNYNLKTVKIFRLNTAEKEQVVEQGLELIKANFKD